MFRGLICSMVLALAGCAAHEVRCDSHLQAINTPLPRPARLTGPNDAPSDAPTQTVDTAPVP